MSTSKGLPWVSQESQDYVLRSPNVERNYCALFSDVAASPVRGKEPSIATANNIDTLLGATESSEIVQPPEAVQDKVHFIFNNISQATLHQKVSLNNLWGTAEVVASWLYIWIDRCAFLSVSWL